MRKPLPKKLGDQVAAGSIGLEAEVALEDWSQLDEVLDHLPDAAALPRAAARRWRLTRREARIGLVVEVVGDVQHAARLFGEGSHQARVRVSLLACTPVDRSSHNEFQPDASSLLASWS